MPTVAVLSADEVSIELSMKIRQLLARAFKGRFSEQDWAHTLGGVRVVVSDAGAVVSHAAVVPRILEVAHRPFDAGYVEGVATAVGRQGEGLGSLAMARLSALIRERFDFGALSTSRHGFYERLGWERWRGPTFVRDGSEEIRTEEEDDGVMVLRFGVSRDIDLTASLSCERRLGDDW
jgi:aminoglycoside 2'-N-acetyltransferase I